MPMFPSRLWRYASRCLFLFLVPVGATHAETHARCAEQFAPRSGEPGKDVMWVATIDEVVGAMLRAANVTNRDRVVDLGSGDGKIPIAAAKQFGAQARGIEYNAQLVQLAECHARVERVADKVSFQQGDIFSTDFSDATVVMLYLSPTINLKLRPTLLDMRPGTRIVSNTFDMADWKPDRQVESAVGNTRAFLWIVPSRIEGEWQFTQTGGEESFILKLRQSFQRLEASPASESPPTRSRLAVQSGRVLGTQVEIVVTGLDAQPTTLSGEIVGDRMLLATSKAGVIRRYVGREL
ncbi:methyltransferase [Steroidobacter agaridevorans]|uniref:Methyltransferase n=1 Tax=Steroidobacter agaridevorans TaxID=2695856 RepID=A0A829Y959_9GAMM|nr:methyltransferase domain-containing protein [Steroidobacter agaridevorans]GFE79112.1 methyltransferase [Steroidobacter agaridevorans]